MLARNRIIFPEAHLLGDVARVFLRHIVKAGVGRADEFDFDGGCFRHDRIPYARI